MIKVLSKSVIIMLMVDFCVLALITSQCYTYFNLPEKLYLLTSITIVITGLCVLFLKSNYKIREFNIRLKNSYLLFEGVVFAHIPALALLLFFANLQSSIKFILANILFVFAGLQLYRALFHLYLFKFKPIKNILIIGANRNAKYIADEIIHKKALRMNIVGLFQDAKSNDEIVQDGKYKVFDKSASLQDIIAKNKIVIVILAINRKMDNNLLSEMVFEIPKNVKIYTMPDFYEMVTNKYFIDSQSINLLFANYMNKRSLAYDICKRAYDIIAALLIFVVTLPITGFTALRIWLTDGENPIYTQNRVGKGGKIFKCYKLRTMWANNYHPKNLQKGGYAENQDVDDRVIPWCKFVRKARFDEIPQMINILKGDMSIVGPRAEWEEVVKIYKQEIPYYNCRMWVKTGWTGWAQINQGHCINNNDVAEKLQYDLFYLKHRNVVWEICILVKAVFLALGGRHE